jgi:enoyl-CoA hydratase
MANDTVLTDIHEGYAIITLNRPDQRNAVNTEVCAALSQAMDRIEKDPAIKVTILQGAGRVFCAGMDLSAFQQGKGEEILFGRDGFAGFVRRQRRKPVIAAIHGAALAGGFEIMLACDLVIAAEGTVFGLPEPKLGLIAGGGGALRLSGRIPRVLANELLLTGGSYDARQMRDWGLLNKVVPAGQLRSEAIKLAQSIAANAAQSTVDTLRVADTAYHVRDDQFWALNDEMLRARFQSEEAREGTKAFLEKRAPTWST